MSNARNLARVVADTSGAIAATNLANAVPADGSITDAKLATAVKPVGVGQTWQNVIGSRSMDTVYTNSTGRPIQLSVAGEDYRGGQAGFITVFINGVAIGQSGTGGNSSYSRPATTNPIVPNGANYSVNSGEPNYDYVTVWFELR